MKQKWTRALAITLSATFAATSLTGILPAQTAQAQEASDGVQAQLYVSPGGSDVNDGSQASPFATVERAREAVAGINGDMTGDIIVNIAAGDYYLDNTLQFGAQDSGTNGFEVIYRSADGISKANLIGGDRITGWTLADQTDSDEYDLLPELLGKVYKVQLDKDKYDFNTMYVNDSRAVMARTRNRDNNPNFPMAKGEYMRSTGGHNNNLNMNYNAAEIDEHSMAGMLHAQERGEEELAQVFVWDGGDWDWFTNTIPIASVNTANSEFKFPTPPADYPEKYRTKYNIGGGARYFLQGNLAFMDVEGEYHYNKSTGILYYYPKSEDGAIENQTIVVPTMEKGIYFKGTEKANLADVPVDEKEVHNITIDGLAVKNTGFPDYFTYSWNWGDGGAGIGHFPKAAEGSTNPSYCESTDRVEFQSGSITMTGTHDITIANTRVKNSGLYGIICCGDNRNNTLTDSVVENTGYGGVIFDGGYPAVGKYNNHNTMDNMLIHEVGELVGHAVGFTLLSSGQNNFTNLEIYDTPKRAVLILGGYRRDRNGGDRNYDEIKDMYTVGNHFKYVHVHDAQQDAGEDSAVFLSWLLAGKDVNALHGSNDPNNLKTNLDGIDLTIDRYNYLEQFLITDVGADPSVIEKCTVGGLDTAMGATGSVFRNVRAANTQHHLLAIRDDDGGGYGDMYTVENTTNNLRSDEVLLTFDDGKMEYDKIGLREDFPNELRVAKRAYPAAPQDIYFSDDFEASRELDTTKWMVEKGELEMHVGYGYMSEDPTVGRRSLPINADKNPDGIVISRTFENKLNKIVEVKYMDRRKDYAGADRTDAVPTEILPNSFLRVDDGANALGLGAAGRVSRDYYQIMKGDQLIQTDVKRAFGWHTFKFDYSSGTDVKLYIDDQLVATYDDVPLTFNYIGMGDWDGIGGKAFFDQLYVYGGKEGPAVEPLPELYSIPGKLEAENYQTMSGVEAEDCDDEEGGRNVTGIHAGDWMKYNVKVTKTGAYDVSWRVNVPAGKTAEFEVEVDGNAAGTISLASTEGKWQTITQRMSLASGLHKIVLTAKSEDWKINWMDYAFAGPEVPCKIQGEDFTAQQGIQIAGVDQGGKCAGYIDDSDWMEYKAVVAEPGIYSVNYNVSVNGTDGIVEFISNGETLATTTLPNTNGWQNWKMVSDLVEFKEAGTVTIRLNVKKGGWNLDWFEISTADIPEKPLPPALDEVIFEEDFQEGQESPLVPSKVGIKQEIVSLTEKALKDALKDGTVSGNSSVSVSGNTAMTVSDNTSAGDNDLSAMEDENKVLYVKSPDGTLYLPSSEELSNYIFECKVMISDWKGSPEGAQPWDNMAPCWYYSQNSSAVRYSLKYNRAQDAFLLYRRSGGDSDMISKKAPEGYMGTWHDYKIVMDNGHIMAYIDEELIFDHTDNAIASGTVGFDGINAEYYLDDISVKRQKTAVPSVDVPSGEFTDSLSLKLTAAQSGATIAYTLDGSDPAVNGTVYENYKGITITKTTTLKFAAVDNGKVYSDIVTCEYVKKEAPVTDKSELQKVYDLYKDLTQGNYTDDRWNAFVLVRNNAKDVLEVPDAAQADVDAARTALEEAFKALEEKPAAGTGYRGLLQKAYGYAKGLSTEGVVDSAAKKFRDALAKAETILGNQQAAEAQLKEAFDELLEATWALGLTQGNKEALELLIAKADTMAAEADKYVAAKWQNLLDALSAAKAVMSDGDAMEEDIKPVSDVLLKAIYEQRFKARKDILEGILNKAEAVDESLYMEESVQVFRAAFVYAVQIMDDDTLSVDDQATVDRAGEKLEKAILNLVKKDDTEEPTDPGNPTDPSNPTDPGDPTDPSNPDDPSTPSDDNNQPSDDGKADASGDSTDSADSGSAGEDGTVVSPKTGDYSNLGLAALIAALGIVCVGFVAVGKKKRED